MTFKKLFSPSRIKEKIKMILFSGDVKRLVSQNRLPDVEMSMIRLHKQGIVPKRIFDIGAYHGEFIETCFKIWPECEVVAFEALPDKVEMLKRKFEGKRVEVVETMVGDLDKENVTFYADENASSALFSDEIDTKKKLLNRRMIKLDSFIEQSNKNAPDFLQIDTLSFEYQIINGIEKNLEFVKVILLQVNFIEVFHEVKLANEVIEYLNRFGFVIYDICDIHRRPLDNALWQADLLFVKKDSPLRSNKLWG